MSVEHMSESKAENLSDISVGFLLGKGLYVADRSFA